ncbi:hypothetical protein BC833DRAFT_589952 [Globomyces pollinis-pini]|nr:hypothetical protein BC833DRAFT_589952 [Globomyces pollinis-pini]
MNGNPQTKLARFQLLETPKKVQSKIFSYLTLFDWYRLRGVSKKYLELSESMFERLAIELGYNSYCKEEKDTWSYFIYDLRYGICSVCKLEMHINSIPSSEMDMNGWQFCYSCLTYKRKREIVNCLISGPLSMTPKRALAEIEKSAYASAFIANEDVDDEFESMDQPNPEKIANSIERKMILQEAISSVGLGRIKVNSPIYTDYILGKTMDDVYQVIEKHSEREWCLKFVKDSGYGVRTKMAVQKFVKKYYDPNIGDLVYPDRVTPPLGLFKPIFLELQKIQEGAEASDENFDEVDILSDEPDDL